MIFPSLIGPAALVLSAAAAVVSKRDRVKLLFDGDPGVGKTTIADAIAAQLTGGVACAVETVNGQSLAVDLVRHWRLSSCYGNLFAAWTVKRVDEIDLASAAAVAELLTFLDMLPARHAVIVTTNEYGKLRKANKGRLESRFIRFTVDAPQVDDVVGHLVHKFDIPKAKARAIALGAVPDGCLASAGCNVRTAENDAEALVAVQQAMRNK